jgi:hypothetical protein
MRALILGLSVLAIVIGPHAANAGLSTVPRDTSASADTAEPADTPPAADQQASQETEAQIGLTKAKRREVQRDLTRLGFATRIDGKFSDSTRAAIGRWQEGHSYPNTGFLNAAQHTALLNESVAAREAGESDRPERHRGGGRSRHARGGVGGPIGVIGGAIGGLFGR